MIIGGGAREHALAWKLASSPRVAKLFIAPGNAGTAPLGHNLNISPTDIEALAQAAEKYRIDLTIVGPEASLALGIVDFFQNRGLTIFGSTQQATLIESSKVWAKELMQKYHIPCAQWASFSSFSQAESYLHQQPLPVVIKADGLAAGKGTIVAYSMEEAITTLDNMMQKRLLGAAADRVIIEEWLEGKEVSLLAFTDGKTVVPMVPVCDYKRAFDGDQGPNTGGMGSYSPPSFISEEQIELARRTILEPTVEAMAQEGKPFKGVLYAGLILTSKGWQVLEFNARFGDPETQVTLPQLKTDLVDILFAVVENRLSEIEIEWHQTGCVGVVMASSGYPSSYQTGFPITGWDKLDSSILVFHAGTKAENSQIYTSGGRVLTVVANDKTVAEARAKVYANLSQLHFEGGFYRQDIAFE
jgi:phosphoribosylamine--glycine ligase